MLSRTSTIGARGPPRVLPPRSSAIWSSTFPLASQMHRPVIRKAVDLTGLVIDPVVRPYFVEVADTDLGGERSDLRLLTDALSEQWSAARS